MYFSALFSSPDDNAISFYGMSFFTIPVIGLYYSLRCRHFMTAFLSTLAVGLVLPLVVPGLIRFAYWIYVSSPGPGPLFDRSFYAGFIQFCLAKLTVGIT